MKDAILLLLKSRKTVVATLTIVGCAVVLLVFPGPSTEKIAAMGALSAIGFQWLGTIAKEDIAKKLKDKT